MDTKEKEGQLSFDMSMISDARMITGSAGNEGVKIGIKEEHKPQIAAFDNGIILAAIGARNKPLTNTIVSSMVQSGISTKQIFEVNSATIKEIYDNYENGAVVQENTETLSRRKKLKDIIDTAVKQRASDIHIYVYEKHADVSFRVFNVMGVRESLPPDEAKGIIEAAFAVAEGQLGSSNSYIRQGALMPNSGLLPRGVSMLRLQYVPTSTGGAVVWRISYGSDPKVIDLAQLGYNQEQIDEITVMKRRTTGLNILAGRVSSGKTTTLQRVVNGIYVENHGEVSIYTIEDPIEIKLIAGAQFNAVPQPDLQNEGQKVDGFRAGIATALRFDINVGVLGEIRTTEVAGQAIQLALTGHALWTTVHAGSALQILERLTDLGVPKFRLADPDLVRGLIYQRLLGRICPHCRITYTQAVKEKSLSLKLAQEAVELFQIHPDHLYARGHGCSKCIKAMAGRTVAAEVIRPNETMLEIFAKENTLMPVREYWLRPKDKDGFGGVPVLHQALVKTGAGLCDPNETEKEVDLLSEYVRRYNHLIPLLRQQIREMRKTEGLETPVLAPRQKPVAQQEQNVQGQPARSANPEGGISK